MRSNTLPDWTVSRNRSRPTPALSITDAAGRCIRAKRYSAGRRAYRVRMPVLGNPRARLLELIVAFRQTQCVRVAVEIGVADQLASGPAGSADLAAACGAMEPFLRRLLRALTGLGLLDQDDDGRYRLTMVGEQMRSDRMGPAALFFGCDPV